MQYLGVCKRYSILLPDPVYFQTRKYLFTYDWEICIKCNNNPKTILYHSFFRKYGPTRIKSGVFAEKINL